MRDAAHRRQIWRLFETFDVTSYTFNIGIDCCKISKGLAQHSHNVSRLTLLACALRSIQFLCNLDGLAYSTPKFAGVRRSSSGAMRSKIFPRENLARVTTKLLEKHSVCFVWIRFHLFRFKITPKFPCKKHVFFAEIKLSWMEISWVRRSSQE